MSISCVEAVVEKYVGKAKGRYSGKFKESSYTPHSLRHSVAVHMLESGIPLPVIKAFLGHANISSTMIYSMADLGMLRTAISSIEDPLKGFEASVDWKSEKEKLKALAGLT